MISPSSIYNGRKTSADIRSEIADLTADSQTLLDRSEAEGRDLTDGELATFDASLESLKALQSELRRVEADEARKLGIVQAQSLLSTRSQTPFGSVRAGLHGIPGMNAQVNLRTHRLSAFKGPDAQRDAYICGN